MIAADPAHGATADLFHRAGGAVADGAHAGGVLHIDAHRFGQIAFDADSEGAAVHGDACGRGAHEMRAAAITGGQEEQKGDKPAGHPLICCEDG